MLAKSSAYVTIYDGQTKWMSFLSRDDNLLENYSNNQNKFSPDMENYFDSETVYDKDFLKTKIKSPGHEITDFYGKGIPKIFLRI